MIRMGEKIKALRKQKNYQGSLCLNGKELRKISIHSWRRQFAFVEQDPYLFAGTVLENIRLGSPEADDLYVQTILEELGLAELAERQMTMEQNELSGGEKQKIAIAM